MEKNKITAYNGRIYGAKVSRYGLENGYLDYATLQHMVGDCILNNNLRAATMEDWYIYSGEFDDVVFQDYIITERGARLLEGLTDELVFYNEELDLYIWSITHFGTSWDYVLTDVKLYIAMEN